MKETLIGNVTINEIPVWGLALIISFFSFIGIGLVTAGELGLGIFSTLIGIVGVSINLLLRRDRYISVRRYGMNFVRDVIRE